MNTVKKYKVTRDFNLYHYIFGNQKYTLGIELSIKNDNVMDGMVELFNINSDFAKNHGEIVERLW